MSGKWSGIRVGHGKVWVIKYRTLYLIKYCGYREKYGVKGSKVWRHPLYSILEGGGWSIHGASHPSIACVDEELPRVCLHTYQWVGQVVCPANAITVIHPPCSDTHTHTSAGRLHLGYSVAPAVVHVGYPDLAYLSTSFVLLSEGGELVCQRRKSTTACENIITNLE